jgi:hypothetical protein
LGHHESRDRWQKPLNPGSRRRESGFFEVPLDENCEEIKAYSPSTEVEQRATIPIMIYGTHNSPRIVAQREVFALFGKGIDGMEKIYSKGSFPAGSLEKIIIEKSCVGDILKSLYRKGFAESTIYPDLFGLSLEIKRRFGYH